MSDTRTRNGNIISGRAGAPRILGRMIWLMAALAVASASPILAAGQANDQAENEATKFYVTGLVGGSFATLDTGGATTAPPASIAGNDSDSSPFGGAAAGAIFDLGALDLRLELEGTGGRSFSLATPGPYATRASLWTLQGNFWFDYPLSHLFPDAPIVRNLAPFAGGGLGVRQTTLDTTGGALAGSTRETGLAWQGGGGLAYRVSERVVFEARYQYADLGGAEIPLFDAGAPAGSMEVDLGSHEVVGGVRFTFR